MNIDKITQATSIKTIIQELAPEQIRLLVGTVIAKGPLKIQALNDDKLIIREDLIILPQWLSDHVYKAYIETEAYSEPDPEKEELKDPFTCYYPCTSPQQAAPKHYYKQTWIKIKNHLEVGDMVQMLAFGGGRKYYVIDRVPLPDDPT